MSSANLVYSLDVLEKLLEHLRGWALLPAAGGHDLEGVHPLEPGQRVGSRVQLSFVTHALVRRVQTLLKSLQQKIRIPL